MCRHWLNYFPPYAKKDLSRMGCRIDWRRSFITTDKNPYYDSFIQWQFNTLRAKNKINFGKRNSVYSPKDGQPCADHDRATGEGVGPQDYTCVKMKIKELTPKMIEGGLEGKDVFCIAATLRPETMYGQTNCFILPDGDYGAYAIDAEEQTIFVMGEHAARNFAYQNMSAVFGETKCLLELKGTDLLGCPLKAPCTPYVTVYMLPMMTISMTKGTGIVTSVPSDSPDDFASLRDLQQKPDLRAKYGITEEMVQFDAIPIIQIDAVWDDPKLLKKGGHKAPVPYGNMAAVAACDFYKVKSQNDKEALKKAKDDVYLKGFYEGVMIVGPQKGAKVCDAKEACRAELIESGEAVKYSEPMKMVMSRSGDECVVALVDQWYLEYGEEEWKAKVMAHVQSDEFETFTAETQNAFEGCLNWLGQWACSRSYGLGTRLPWDKDVLIESLSDSTIYMAYYSVAYTLQGGVLNGSEVGPGGIKPEQMTHAVWDFIFQDGEYPECEIAEELLAKMRAEFKYWYPMDLRVSGKDLINNHLTMALYNHAAIWEDKPELWPRAYKTNGHAMVNGAKMSKSLGNFMTINQAVEKFSADAMRLGLADAGDGNEDANFEEATVNKAILRMTTEIDWVKEKLAALGELESNDASTWASLVFESEINQCIADADRFNERMCYKDALRVSFYSLQAARDLYRQRVGENGMAKAMVAKYIESFCLLNSVFVPHFCDYLYGLLNEALGKPEASVQNARWPECGAVDQSQLDASAYLEDVKHEYHQRLTKLQNPKAKKGQKAVKLGAPSQMTIVIATEYPPMKKDVLEFLNANFDAEAGEFPKDLMKRVKGTPAIAKNMKKIMPFMKMIQQRVAQNGTGAMSLTSTFNEAELLEANRGYFGSSFGVGAFQILSVSEASPEQLKKCGESSPGDPSVSFDFPAPEAEA